VGVDVDVCVDRMGVGVDVDVFVCVGVSVGVEVTVDKRVQEPVPFALTTTEPRIGPETPFVVRYHSTFIL
jgi:hypothetical protein